MVMKTGVMSLCQLYSRVYLVLLVVGGLQPQLCISYNHTEVQEEDVTTGMTDLPLIGQTSGVKPLTKHGLESQSLVLGS